MEIPSARPHTPTAIQHVRPIATSEGSMVLAIVGSLDSKN
ncbi:Uncharacterised protein [Segatella copri]|nr:Uncharacterised protein [Segatella copri]